jgi:hypothetical protein
LTSIDQGRRMNEKQISGEMTNQSA